MRSRPSEIRYKNYQIAEDYRSFKKYVATTIRGRAKTEYNQRIYGITGMLAKRPRQREGTLDITENLSAASVNPTQWDEEQSVRKAAAWADVSLRTIYDLIKK